MLDTFRRFGTTGFGKYLLAALMGLLIVSFGIWGIADVFRGYGQGALAKIGAREIHENEFNFELQNEVQREMQMAARYGQHLSQDQARMFASQQVLGRLVSQAAIDQHAQEMKLGLADSGIAELIRTDPEFQNPDGSFNKAAFDAFLRQIGLNEATFISRQRADSVRHQITDTLVSGLIAPEPLIEALNRFQNETRTVNSFVLGADKIDPVPEPDAAKLKQFYEEQKRQFVTPELRHLSLVVLSVDALKKSTPVSDDDIKTEYDARKESFVIPETRHVQQMTFTDRAAADDALKQIRAGKDFADVAKALGRKESEYDLGTQSQKQMLDQKIAAAAFALPKGKVSDVVDGEYALALVRSTEVTPGKTRSLEEVTPELRDKLASGKAQARIDDLYKAVEDGRAGGQPLKEIAAKQGLEFQDITAVDRRGNGADGKAVPAFAGPAAQVLQAAFGGGGVGVENEAVQLADGGYAWFDVVGVTAEKQKTEAEVADELKAKYLEGERRRALQTKAQSIVDRISKGEQIAALAKEFGGTLAASQSFKRNARGADMPPQAIAMAFSLANNGAGAAEAADGKGRLILQITNITLPAAASGITQQTLKNELTRQMQNDVVSEYIGALQNRLGLTVNQAELQRLLTGAAGQ